jgi:hypothetical protein
MPRSFATHHLGIPPRHARHHGADRLPAGIALPIILALSALGWLGVIAAARLLLG